MSPTINKEYFIDSFGNIQWFNIIVLGGIIYTLWQWIEPLGKKK